MGHPADIPTIKKVLPPQTERKQSYHHDQNPSPGDWILLAWLQLKFEKKHIID